MLSEWSWSCKRWISFIPTDFFSGTCAIGAYPFWVETTQIWYSGKLVACIVLISSRSDWCHEINWHSSTTLWDSNTSFFVRFFLMKLHQAKLSLPLAATSWVSWHLPSTKAAGKHRLPPTETGTRECAKRFWSNSVWTCFLFAPPEGIVVRVMWMPKLLSTLNLFC